MQTQKNFVGYVRVSTSEQVDNGLSINAQVDKIEKYAQQNNLNLVTILIEKGISGSVELKKREQGKKLFELIKNKEIEGVVICKLDRAFRSSLDSMQVLNYLEKKGIELCILDLQINTQSVMGKFTLQLLGAVAEMERGLIRSRVREIMQYKKNNKERVSLHANYGKQFTIDNKIEDNLEELKVILEIKRLHSLGYNLSKVAREISKKYKTRTGKNWQVVQVKRILNVA